MHGVVQDLFRVGRHLMRAVHYRLLKVTCTNDWASSSTPAHGIGPGLRVQRSFALRRPLGTPSQRASRNSEDDAAAMLSHGTDRPNAAQEARKGDNACLVNRHAGSYESHVDDCNAMAESYPTHSPLQRRTSAPANHTSESRHPLRTDSVLFLRGDRKDGAFGWETAPGSTSFSRRLRRDTEDR